MALLKGKFVGIKRIKGEKNGKAFDFSIACITSDFEERDVEKCNARGVNVHCPSVPEKFADILTEKNIGKDIEVDFYFNNGRENIAYCALTK